MTTVEVMLMVPVRCLHLCQQPAPHPTGAGGTRVVPKMLSESCFNRRCHKIIIQDWQGLLSLLAQEHSTGTYLVDRCPFSVCHNRRATRSRLYQDEGNAYWGYCAAKEENYYGLKAHGNITKVVARWKCSCCVDAVPT
jgi:hypothetical protein